jgi:serine protease AprX
MRKTLAVTALVALLVGGLAPTASARTITTTATTTARTGSLTPALQAVLDSLPPGEMTTVVVTLRDQTELKPAPGTKRAARLKGTIQALKANADATQAPIRTLLRARGTEGRVARTTPLWIVNGVSVTATADVIQALAVRPDVASITTDQIAIAPTFGTPEPNLVAASAPALWDLGFTGQGVVVASLDSGVDVTHPDLASRWRGGTDSWFDPYGEHPTTPTDLSGHGTATTGAILGGDAGGTTIGMAPGARWIAAKIFNDRGAATATAIHQAFQWALDPDHDPNTPDAPQIVNGSWSIGAGPGCDLSFQPDLKALRAAGILPVFAAGNYGSGASTSVSPANYPEAVSVGAVNGNDLISSSSSRGPSVCGARARTFPDLVAPGDSIRTTDRYGLYQTASGTSMAAPHAAGALALLLGALPGLTIDQAQAALTGTALDLGVSGPDPAYGNGRLNVLAAYQWLLAQGPTVDLTGPATVSATVTPSLSNGTADAAVHATGDDTATGGSAIAAAEYFVDAPGVAGTGTAMAVTPATPAAGATAGATAGLDAAILAATLNALADGSHTISVHAKDAAGNWGATTNTTLLIDKVKPTVSAVSATPNPTQGATTVNLTAQATDALTAVDRAEWFTGTDPGAGNATPMTITGTGPWTLAATITTSNWNEGAYTLTMRSRDAAGNWSVTGSTVLQVQAALSFSTFGNTNPPGVAGTADDADLYTWNGTAFTRAIDASASPYDLPSGANVDGFDRVSATAFYLSFTGQVTVPGLGAVQDEDVVYFNGATWSLFFDGSIRGLTGTAATDLDAISIVGGQLYFSTDNAAIPPGAGGSGDDADIYRWNGASSFTRVVDASAAPYTLPGAANVDGFVRVDATHFYLSFSADSTTVPVLGVVQDEDVIYYNAGTWSVYFDGTAHGLTTGSHDVDAFDVP